jgi:hypothetical protein
MQLLKIVLHALTTKKEGPFLLTMAHQMCENMIIPIELALTHIIPK